MHPTPYLFFNGNCAEALAAYAEIFDSAVEDTMLAGSMPEDVPVPDDKKDWIMHAAIKIGDGMIMASDNIMETSEAMAGCSVMIEYADVDEARRIFNRLADGGEVTMAFEPTFWSAGFGAARDRFGIRWMVGCSEPPPG